MRKIMIKIKISGMKKDLIRDVVRNGSKRARLLKK
jgi:hypothetical protein